jgi:hypothetical protein
MISSRFWERFGVGARQPQVIEGIKDLLDEQGLNVEARSEKKLVTSVRTNESLFLT